jgi:hypothetical protein
MSGDDRRDGTQYDEPRVPRPLRDQVDELFVAARGYEPASFQEALSVVTDLAAQSLGAATDAADDRSGPSALPAASSTNGGAASASTGPDVAAGEQTTDATDVDGDADTSQSTGSLDAEGSGSVRFDDYVDELAESSQGPSPGVETVLDTENADGVVRELAAEVLDEMTQDAFQELEHGVDQGVGTGVTDGMGGTRAVSGDGTAPSGSKGDGVPDSLTADPESDCAVCGREHPVSVLQTTILEEDGSIALVCPSCAE